MQAVFYFSSLCLSLSLSIYFCSLSISLPLWVHIQPTQRPCLLVLLYKNRENRTTQFHAPCALHACELCSFQKVKCWDRRKKGGEETVRGIISDNSWQVENELKQYVIFSDVVSHPGATSCISGSGGYSEEARCYGVGRFSESEHRHKSCWSEEKQADNEDQEAVRVGGGGRPWWWWVRRDEKAGKQWSKWSKDRGEEKREQEDAERRCADRRMIIQQSVSIKVSPPAVPIRGKKPDRQWTGGSFNNACGFVELFKRKRVFLLLMYYS